MSWRNAGVLALALALATGALALATGASLALGASSPSPPSLLVEQAAPAPLRAPDYRSVRTYDSVAAPVRLRIPSAGVDSPLDRVGLASDGTIAAPGAWRRAAWYERGPRPGQRGPAVIVGHVDSRTGPAVFSRLAAVAPGALVTVARDDGTTVRFRVTGVRQVPKDTFPVEAVYAPTLRPSLVLMTCGGDFDPSTGHYVDNVLVLAAPE